MPTIPAHEATILEHLVGVDKDKLPKSVARYLLSIKFPPEDIDCINALSAKARDGSLSSDESDHLDSYLRIGHMLSMMKSKARRSSKDHPGTR